MAGLTMRVQIDDREVKRAVREAIKRGRNLRPLLKEIGHVLLTSVSRNFQEGGRPAWEPLAPSTILQKLGGAGKAFTKRTKTGSRFLRKGAQRRAGSVKILIGTRRAGASATRLAKSVTFETGRAHVDVGTNVVYAATHQYGRDDIPARPFLAVQAEDQVEMVRAVEAHFAKALGRRG